MTIKNLILVPLVAVTLTVAGQVQANIFARLRQSAHRLFQTTQPQKTSLPYQSTKPLEPTSIETTPHGTTIHYGQTSEPKIKIVFSADDRWKMCIDSLHARVAPQSFRNRQNLNQACAQSDNQVLQSLALRVRMLHRARTFGKACLLGVSTAIGYGIYKKVKKEDK